MSNWRKWLTQDNPSWPDRAARFALWLASLVYGLAIVLRNRLYDWGVLRVHASSLPVVSIGNLSVGGTGKSPAVAWIAQWFRQHNLRVAILSRGYGQLDDGRNDEALELELKLPDVPHLQHWNRVASARLAHEELDMQVLVLDDGFQHRRIARDLDIVLIDATDNSAAQRLLPVGLRREPMSSLKRAQAVVITRANQVAQETLAKLESRIKRCKPQATVALASHRASKLLAHPDIRIPLEQIKGQRVLAFCGIGNPEAFFSGLENLGAQVVANRAWPDHHVYSAGDIEWLSHWEKRYAEAKFVCTVKDWVKIQESRIGQRDLWALAIELDFLKGQLELENLLHRVIDRVTENET